MDRVILAKDQGNEAFKKNDYSQAIDLYREALESLQHVDVSNDEKKEISCILFCNRSNALFKLGMFKGSITQANAALDVDIHFDKAYYRKAIAHEALHEEDEVIKTYQDAIKNANDTIYFKRLLQKHLANRKKQQTTSSSQEDQSISRKGQKLVHDIRNALRNGNLETLDGGLMSKLQDPEMFCQIMYNSKESPKQQGIPKTFTELLMSDNYYDALVALYAKIANLSNNVFKGAQAKGAMEGDFMDPALEETLRRFTMNEAFAHAIVDFMKESYRTYSVTLSERSNLVAQWHDDNEEQLDALHIEELANDERMYTVVDGFLGDHEWQELLVAEAREMFHAGIFEPRNVTIASKNDYVDPKRSEPVKGLWSCWLTHGQCESHYPAFEELLRKIELLPGELNKKIPGLDLRVPIFDAILVTAIGNFDEKSLPPYSGTSRVHDGCFGPMNNGLKLTTMYQFLSAMPSDSGRFVLRAQQGTETIVEPQYDRLVIFRSRTMSHEHTICDDPNVLRFFVRICFHGPAQEPIW